MVAAAAGATLAIMSKACRKPKNLSQGSLPEANKLSPEPASCGQQAQLFQKKKLLHSAARVLRHGQIFGPWPEAQCCRLLMSASKLTSPWPVSILWLEVRGKAIFIFLGS